VAADEEAKDIYDRGMVAGRIAGDLLQRINTANAHIELLRAELLDRPGEAISYLAPAR
jgi:hypothetical protein